MENKEIQTLSIHRLEQAKENLEEAKLLYKDKKYKGTNNRAYYSIFHAVRAVLALDQKDFKKHSSVIAYFNENYINKNIFPKELGRKVHIASSYREKSDYLDFYIVSKQECQSQIETAEELIQYVEEYINNYIKNNNQE